MPEPMLQTERLGKLYRLEQPDPNRGLRHVLHDAVARPWRRWRNPAAAPARAAGEFWAVRDLDMAIQAGQVVGIIGRNGAGKSTLLKLLSRITAPTTGAITLRGRVASLLEVGTGFHPELSGRENIYLNGAILGMTRSEIARKFDEIVSFAEIERFLDTPVKRYSSGMYMRLAFAVAAHLEPEILIVDEVLAVGDAAFQQKCLGKMDQVARQHGRTVLFVSHNLAAVQRLCSNCKLLDAGRLVADGPPPEVIRRYLQLSAASVSTTTELAPGQNCAVQICVTDEAGARTRTWAFDRPLRFHVTLRAGRPLVQPAIDLTFYDERRVRLFSLQSDRLNAAPERLEGTWTALFTVRNPGLTVTELIIDVGVREGAGSYLLLCTDAEHVYPDYSTLPEAAAGDCLLHPESSQAWLPAPSAAVRAA